MDTVLDIEPGTGLKSMVDFNDHPSPLTIQAGILRLPDQKCKNFFNLDRFRVKQTVNLTVVLLPRQCHAMALIIARVPDRSPLRRLSWHLFPEALDTPQLDAKVIS